MTRSQQKHNYRSWLKSRQREIEAREWGHTNMASLIVCASTWERGGGRQLQRSRITASVCKLGESERERGGREVGPIGLEVLIDFIT